MNTAHKRILALDGMRTIGAWFILAGHLHLGIFTGGEGWGNVIFFMLSGFCIAAPWEDAPEARFMSLRGFFRFYWSRFISIAPLYFLSIGLLLLFGIKVNVWDQIFFVRPWGIAWFLQVIALFYLCVPFLMFGIACLKKSVGQSDGLASAFLLGLSLWIYQYGDFATFTDGEIRSIGFATCLVGMALGFLVKIKRIRALFMEAYFVRFISVSCIIVTGCILTGIIMFQDVQGMACDLLTGMLLLGCVSSGGGHASAYEKLLSLPPLVSIGKLSFGILLFHLQLHYVLPGSGILHFVLVFFCSVFCAYIADICIDHGARFASACARSDAAAKLLPLCESAVLVLYISAVFWYAHHRPYPIGEKLGFSYADSIGRHYAEGLGKINAQDSILEKKCLRLNLNVRNETMDLPLFLEMQGKFHSIPSVLAEGQPANIIFFEDGYFISEIQSECTDNELNLEVRFAADDQAKIAVSDAIVERRDWVCVPMGEPLSFASLHPTANPYFVRGLGAPEERATWAKEAAAARFYLPENIVGHDLYLRLSWAAVDSRAQRMAVYVQGANIFSGSFPTEGKTSIHIPGSLNRDRVLALRFEFPDACPSSFAFSSMQLTAGNAVNQ